MMVKTVVQPVESRRAPKQARSRATRRKILDATVECLVDRGHAGSSTTEIGQRAGVSQGALFKHFASKVELLSAAVEHLFATMVEDYRRSFSKLAAQDPGGRLSGAIRLLRQTFAEPRLQAAFELYVAARTDAELRGAIEPALRAHRDNLRLVARGLFAQQAAGNDRFDAVVDVLLNTMQGAALGSAVLPDLDREEPALEALERWARLELEGVA
ncbi:MAG: TetR/AcrR family transcriptional regulator [Candidatus Binatia bacterium]|nr:TetR/AcrR family transcriptional regulator [Candidatus Binatia bacterium]